MSPQRDREDFLTLMHTGRLFRLNISEECMQGHKAMIITTESEQKSEQVAVCLDGVWADISLCSQIMRQKARHVDRQIGRFHGSILRGMTSPKAASDRAVISGKSSAVR